MSTFPLRFPYDVIICQRGGHSGVGSSRVEGFRRVKDGDLFQKGIERTLFYPPSLILLKHCTQVLLAVVVVKKKRKCEEAEDEHNAVGL